MRVMKLPEAPNPDDLAYKSNPIAYNRAIYKWMQVTKGIIEQASIINDTPLNQPFLVTTGYTLTTSISGTATGTQVSNFLCTLVAAMTKKGLVTALNFNTNQ